LRKARCKVTGSGPQPKADEPLAQKAHPRQP
jgi:hypothetical protein